MSPFSPPSTHLVIKEKANNGEVIFDMLCSSCSAFADAEAFILLVRMKLSEQEALEVAFATDTPTTSSSSSSISASSTTVGKTAGEAPLLKLTARKRAGRDLSEQLLKVAKLRNRHKIKDAEDFFLSLDNTLSEESTLAKENELARRRVLQLRDCFFSMGGFSLTRRVLESAS